MPKSLLHKKAYTCNLERIGGRCGRGFHLVFWYGTLLCCSTWLTYHTDTIYLYPQIVSSKPKCVLFSIGDKRDRDEVWDVSFVNLYQGYNKPYQGYNKPYYSNDCWWIGWCVIELVNIRRSFYIFCSLHYIYKLVITWLHQAFNCQIQTAILRVHYD